MFRFGVVSINKICETNVLNLWTSSLVSKNRALEKNVGAYRISLVFVSLVLPGIWLFYGRHSRRRMQLEWAVSLRGARDAVNECIGLIMKRNVRQEAESALALDLINTSPPLSSAVPVGCPVSTLHLAPQIRSLTTPTLFNNSLETYTVSKFKARLDFGTGDLFQVIRASSSPLYTNFLEKVVSNRRAEVHCIYFEMLEDVKKNIKKITFLKK